MTFDIALTLAILAMALVLFIWDRLRVDVVGLIVMATLMIVGLLTPSEAVSGFSNEAVLTVGAMFALSSGLLRTGAIDVLGRWIARLAGKSELRLLVVSLAIIIPLSAFINNTPVVAVMIPVVLGLTRQTGLAPSRIFMPISFGSQLGGTLTLIGTSTNLLVAGLVLELGLPRMNLFDITLPGLVIAAVGVFYLLTIGRLLLPTRAAASDLEQTYELRDYMTVLRVTGDSPFAGRSLRGSRFGENVGLQVIGIEREGRRIMPRGSSVLEPGDVLIVSGKIKDIAQISESDHLEILGSEPPKNVFAQASDQEKESERRMAEVMVPPRSIVVGRTLKELNFRRRYDLSVLGVQRHGVILHDKLAELRFRSGDMLLVEGYAPDLQQVHDAGDLALLGAVTLPARRTRKMKIAVAIMVGVVLSAAVNVVPIMVAAVVGAVAMFITGCLKPEEAWEDMDWMVLILLASLIPLGIAMQSSGTADLIASQLMSVAGVVGPYGALALLYVVTSLLTEVISNNAAAVVLVPVAIAMAAAMALSPLPFVVAVMFAASNAFMSPVGYQTNTFIYAPGGYKFSDFVRVGGPLNVLIIAVATFVIPMFFPF
jgi:di/tricarboxylate transporter